jgi:serine/threonine kinase 16
MTTAFGTDSVRAMHKYRLPDIPQSAGAESEHPFSNPSTASYPPKSKLDVPTLERGESSNALEPLIDKGQVVFDGDEELVDEQNERSSRPDKGKGKATDEGGIGELIPYAHRDIKPG